MFYYDPVTLKKYATRWDALTSPNPRAIQFYYHDDIFTKVDWTSEPTASLEELYTQRAVQLREQYGRIYLAFSGGADSTNILKIFVKSSLKLDGIIVVGAFSQDDHSESDQNHNGELYHNAFPLLDQLRLSGTQILQFDYTKLFDTPNNFSILRDYGTDWVKHIGSFFSPHNYFWRDITSYVRDAGIMFGVRKPELFIDEEGRPYTTFSDMELMAYGNNHLNKIFFYTSPETIDLMKKQAHTLWHVYQQTSPEIWHTNKAKLINRSIYRDQGPDAFVSPKSANPLLSLRDLYLRNAQGSSLYAVYRDGIRNLLASTNFGDNFRSSLIQFSSRRYYLN